MACVGFDPLQQGRARVLHGHTRDALQLVHLRLAELFDFFAQRIVVTYLFFERVLLFLQTFQLFVQIFFFLNGAPLQTGHLVAPLLQLGFGFVFNAQRFLLGFDHALFALGFGLFLRIFDDPSGFRLGGADGLFRNALAVDEAGKKTNHDARRHGADRDYDLHRFSS